MSSSSPTRPAVAAAAAAAAAKPLTTVDTLCSTSVRLQSHLQNNWKLLKDSLPSSEDSFRTPVVIGLLESRVELLQRDVQTVTDILRIYRQFQQKRERSLEQGNSLSDEQKRLKAHNDEEGDDDEDVMLYDGKERAAAAHCILIAS
jgi:hypothetical protein